MQTRLQEKQRMEQAAAVLASLGTGYKLKRTLSHQEEARRRAIELFPQTVPGQTILVNFFVSREQASVEWVENRDHKMVHCRMDGPYDTMPTEWTYSVTDFPIEDASPQNPTPGQR